MKYWIIIDDRHAGPFSAQQLLETGLTPDTLVWYEGLPDWTRAANVAELADGLRQRAMAEAEARERLVAESDARHAQEAAQAAGQFIEPDRIADDDAMQPQEQESTAEIIETSAPAQPQQPSEAQPQLPTAQPQPQQPAAAMQEPCPPSYIAWSIIATLLCCTIVGIPGIVFASMTKSAYYRGDLAKAKRYSDTAQWFIIAAITLGAVSWPFQMAFMGMIQ